ncbi:MAG: DUF86 domain-containing protein [Planctomycetota bacterium]
MQLDVLKWLEDIRMAAEDIQTFALGRSLEEYQQNRMLRMAIERAFMTVGEGLSQLRRIDPDTAHKITGQQQIISFRHHLAHRYWEVRDEVVWSIITDDVPILIREVRELLAAGDPTFDHPPPGEPQSFERDPPQTEA